MIGNPYDAPSSVPYGADESRRPVGVTILSVLAGIIGLVLLGMFVVLVVNWRENNEFFVAQRMAPSLFWLFVGSSVVMALVSVLCIGITTTVTVVLQSVFLYRTR